MDMKSFAQDLAVLRTVSERMNRISTASTAVWTTRGNCLVAGTPDNLMVISPDEAVKLDKPVNLERLYTAVRMLPRGHIVQRPDGIAVVSSGTTDEIEYMKGEPWKLPAGAPFDERSTAIKVTAEALEYVGLAMSNETVRYSLQGVFFDSKNDAIVASDGKRLQWRPFVTEKKFPPIVIPSAAVHGLIAAMRREELPIKRLRLSEKTKDDPEWASLLVDRCMIYTKLLQSKFPDWKAVLPGPFACELRLDAERFRSASKDLVAFVRGAKAGAAYFDCHDGVVDLVGSRTPGGTRRHQLQVVSSRGDKQAIHLMAFNPEYLFESSWNDRETVLQVANQTKAMVVDGCSVVMPVTKVERIEAAQISAAAIGAKLYCSIPMARSEPVSTWRRKAVAKIKDPLAEELAPKAAAPAPARFKKPVEDTTTFVDHPPKKPVPAAPDPMEDKRKRSLKTEAAKPSGQKQYDFLFHS